MEVLNLLQSNDAFIPEDDGIDENLIVPQNWPNSGNIRIENAWLRYNKDANPALKGLNVIIEAGTKAIVVGRTGAGKSSLLSAIVRLAKLEYGKITVDGYDINDMKVNDLRAGISVIPQEPILLRGNFSQLKTLVVSVVRFQIMIFDKHLMD